MQSLAMFQFLIVQLKAAGVKSFTVPCLFQFLIVQLKVITVPFQFKNLKFQFLIVQLKDGLQASNELVSLVSIPYSTIKSLKTLTHSKRGVICFNSL